MRTYHVLFKMLDIRQAEDRAAHLVVAPTEASLRVMLYPNGHLATKMRRQRQMSPEPKQRAGGGPRHLLVSSSLLQPSNELIGYFGLQIVHVLR
jgi:hypothetical protein